jgi:hypothetical protein
MWNASAKVLYVRENARSETERKTGTKGRDLKNEEHWERIQGEIAGGLQEEVVIIRSAVMRTLTLNSIHKTGHEDILRMYCLLDFNELDAVVGSPDWYPEFEQRVTGAATSDKGNKGSRVGQV